MEHLYFIAGVGGMDVMRNTWLLGTCQPEVLCFIDKLRGDLKGKCAWGSLSFFFYKSVHHLLSEEKEPGSVLVTARSL